MFLESAKKFLAIEAQAILGVMGRLDGNFIRAVDLISAGGGRLATTGMGKSGLIAQKISATLSSTGTPSFFMHPAEAIHGDLGMLVPGDVVLALSHSGDTEEILRLLETIKRLGCPLIVFTGNLLSPLAEAAEVVLDISVEREACPLGLAPTASTTAALALGDALALALLEKRGFTEEDFAVIHPGGNLGKKLRRVESLMRSGDAAPRVGPDAPMADVIYEISKKGMGMTSVVDPEGRILGIITDGDLRRLIQADPGALQLTASRCMNPNPATIAPRKLAGEALRVMEERRITSLLVADEANRLEGVLHLHDLWRTQLF